MELDVMAEVFEKHSDEEYLEFGRVENKFSNRPDLHAFLLLDKLVPGTSDIVSAAEHDEIYLGVSVVQLAKVIEIHHIIELLRCGVLYDDGVESLHMFA